MTTPIPTPEALRHRASARRWALAGEWTFTLASALTNVVVISAAGGDLLRILLGGLAPVVLAAMSRLLAKLMQAELVVSGVHRTVALAVAGAVGLIGAGAFYLSFETLRQAAEPDHGGAAWVFPATLDLAIVVCAVVLAVIARADEQDQRNGVPPRVTLWNRITARFSAESDPARAAGAVARHDDADRPVHDLVYPSTLTWHAAPDARHDADQEQGHGAAPQSATSNDAVTRQPDAQVDDAVTEPLTRITDAPTPAADDADQAPPSMRQESVAPRSTDTYGPVRDPELTRTAETPAAATNDADAELILRLIAEGATGTKAAAELGVSKSTALRRMREVRNAAGLAGATA